MAVTKIWTIHEGSDIKSVIDYAANEEKTDIHVKADDAYNMLERQQFQDVIDYTMEGYQDEYAMDDMGNVLSYAARGEKTEERKFVTGINCSPEHARDQMMITKNHYHKKDGILLWHGYQSFRPGEVTPEEAHAIGVELAKNLWGDGYEVLVCTHLDTAHIHNHFVINSVSFRTGKKLDVRWKDMAKESDRLCEMFGKSIVENPQRKGRHYAEYAAEKEGRATWTSAIRQDIDESIAKCRSIQEFFRELKSRGYTVKADTKYFTLKPPGKERFVRIDRRLGETYSLGGIARRIEEYARRSGSAAQDEKRHAKHAYAQRPKYKISGFRALYIRYSYMLGCYPGRHMTAKQVHYLYREELVQMHKIARETSFLCRNKIETLQDLADAEYEIKQDLARYMEEKKHIVNRLRSASGEEKEELHHKLDTVNRMIKDCRSRLSMCRDIFENSSGLKDKVTKIRELERGMEHERDNERTR